MTISLSNDKDLSSISQCPISKKHTQEIDFYDHEFNANPFPMFAYLREESPIHRIILDDNFPVWLITRYDDVMSILKNSNAGKSPPSSTNSANKKAMPVAYLLRRGHMLSKDPPDHTRLRKLVQKVFTPKLIEHRRSRIQQLTNDLLDRVQENGKMDLINDFAYPLPITIIADLLGIPKEDHDKLRKWADILIEAHVSEKGQQLMEQDAYAFTEYLKSIFELRRKDPRDDLISALLTVEDQSDVLSQEELYSMVFLLLIAGFETTVNLIGNGVLELLTHPAQMLTLQQQPHLIKRAIEEILRYSTSVHTSTMRLALEDIVIKGKTIPKGEGILVVLASANRDPDKFNQQDVFDITRTSNSHIAFGSGIHVCLGAPLARLEVEIAIGTLLKRLPNLKLAIAKDALEWRLSMVVRGIRSIPVTF